MTPCIEWPGATNAKGYGIRKVGGRKGKVWLVHRLAWAIRYGDPGEMKVLHCCDNPPCMNTDHLFLGTVADNNRDCWEKGRHPKPTRGSHCPHGHDYAIHGRPRRGGTVACNACGTNRQRLRRQRARAQ